MQLLTLGRLELTGTSYKGQVPLLLLTYLTLEGPLERRYVAELFWPRVDKDKARNSLSSAKSRLGRMVPGPGPIDGDELRVWSQLKTCDAVRFETYLLAKNFEAALELYQGPFLDAVEHPEGSGELEEWIYARREQYARGAREAFLRLAESSAAKGDFALAAERAQQAHTLEIAPSYEPEALSRFYLLLQASAHPLTQYFRDEAAEYGIDLSQSPAEARARLQNVLIGRERERQLALGLVSGELAWLRGGPGSGKTALLKTLPGTLLPGRSGLPFATLEPLISNLLHQGEQAVLDHLRKLEGLWLIDNWERVDAESKALLRRLRAVGFRASVVVSARERARVAPDVTIDLKPLTPQDLKAYEGLWERTSGLPIFVDAFLQQRPLAGVLAECLGLLPETAQEVFLALALLDTPDLARVRRALALDAALMAEAFEQLLEGGLVEPHGQVRLRQVALDYLETKPTLLGPLALKLARELDLLAAFSLYERSRAFWHAEDAARARESYYAFAKELLRRGFPERAAQLLAPLAERPEGQHLRGRALEKAGRFKEAYAATEGLPETDVLALRASLLERLGRPHAAKEAAERALGLGAEERAEAHMVLGRLELKQTRYQEAARYFRRAAALYQALDRQVSWAEALNNEAVALSGVSDAVSAFEGVLSAVADNRALKALALVNLGTAFEKQLHLGRARAVYEEAAALAAEAGAVDVSALAWNNLGVTLEETEPAKAREAYEQAGRFARLSGNRRMSAVTLANLAALERNREAWDEAMHLLRAGGHLALIETFYAQLPRNHPWRQAAQTAE